MNKHLFTLLFVALTSPSLAADIVKPAYIISPGGDTIPGQILLRETKKGHYNFAELFISIRFKDSTGIEKIYSPAQIRGFGYTFGSDSSYAHFLSFANVEMRGTFGTKKETVFLVRECSGIIDVYYIYHKNDAFVQTSWMPEVYLYPHHDSSAARLTWIPYDKLQFGSNALIYKKTTISPYLKEWPEENLAEVPKEFPISTLFMVVSSYNLWWRLHHQE